MDGPLPLILLIVVVAIYTAAKIRRLMRQSDQQWQDVDKSKLKEWVDDEDD